MTCPLVLTFDIGTQSTTAMLVDNQGNIVIKKQKKYDKPYYSKDIQYAEQRADFYWEALCEVSLSLKEDSGELWKDIIAVTCTTIRDSCVCVDKYGEPLRDLILWLDKRETEVIGNISLEASEATGIDTALQLIATGSDKGCETLGLSCLTADKAAVSFSTTATVQITTDRYMEPLPFIPAYPAVLKDQYNPEIQIYRGYWLISWFKNEFASKEVQDAKERGIDPDELLNFRLKEIPPGCSGLMFQPYFTPGVVMPKARGEVIGFSDIHTRIHIYRAIIEGINFALIDGLKTIEKMQ